MFGFIWHFHSPIGPSTSNFWWLIDWFDLYFVVCNSLVSLIWILAKWKMKLPAVTSPLFRNAKHEPHGSWRKYMLSRTFSPLFLFRMDIYRPTRFSFNSSSRWLVCMGLLFTLLELAGAGRWKFVLCPRIIGNNVSLLTDRSWDISVLPSLASRPVPP